MSDHVGRALITVIEATAIQDLVCRLVLAIILKVIDLFFAARYTSRFAMNLVASVIVNLHDEP